MNDYILVIETTVSGHRGVYLRWILEAFLEEGKKVVVAMPHIFKLDPSLNGLYHENLEYYLYCSNEKNNFIRSNKIGLIIQDVLRYRQFSSLYEACAKRVHVDFVFIPFIDHIFYSSSIFGSPFGKCKFSGISMRPDFHGHRFGLKVPRKKDSFIRELLFKKFLKVNTLSSLLTLDETLYLYFKNSLSERLRFLPEPAEYSEIPISSIDVIANKLDVNSMKRSILVFGSITRRKGVHKLIDSFSKLTDTRNLQIIIAGKADSKMQDYYSMDKPMQLKKQGKLKIIDRYISEEEEKFLFSRAFISWLGYIGHYRASGVLITSAKYKIPVIATNQGVIGWQVERHGLGVLVDANDLNEIINAITKLCNNSEYYSNCKINASNAFSGNTLDNAKNIVKKSMDVL